MKSMLIVFTLLAAGSLMGQSPGQSPGETTGNITFAPHSTFVSHIAVASFVLLLFRQLCGLPTEP